MLLRLTWLTLFSASLFHLSLAEDFDDENEVGTESDDIYDGPSQVIELTDDNADQILSENPLIFVKFYAPWCGHCKAFAEPFDQMSKSLKKLHNLPTAKIDCDEHKTTCGKYEVQGYPTLKVFKDNVAYDYSGAREENAITQKMLEINSPDWQPPKSAVLELSPEDFDQTVNNNDFTLVMFYAPWCGHCKKMKPEFERAAQDMIDSPPEGARSPPVLAKVDCTQHDSICKKYDVSGYPTLKIFRQGGFTEYKGGRDYMGILQEVKKYMGPASVAFETVNEARRAVLDTAGQPVLVFCHAEDDEEAIKFRDDLANEFRVDWLDIAHCTDPEQQKAINCQNGDTFLVHDKNFRSKLEPERFPIKNADDVNAAKRPLVGQVTMPNQGPLYSETDKPTVRIFAHFDFTPKYRKASQLIRQKVLNVAKKFKDDFYFGLHDEDEHKESMKICQMEDSPEDVNICVTQGPKKVWPLLDPEDNFSEELLIDFLHEVKNGKKPFVKSAKAPKKNDGPVTIVTGNTFEQIVMDPKKDVLIEFYAPWCGHCKQLEPIYKKLGKFYKDDADLVIAKMDMIANDIPNENIPEVTGFPTIKFVTKSNQVVDYDGSRDLKGFKKFIKQERTAVAGKDEL